MFIKSWRWLWTLVLVAGLVVGVASQLTQAPATIADGLRSLATAMLARPGWFVPLLVVAGAAVVVAIRRRRRRWWEEHTAIDTTVGAAGLDAGGLEELGIWHSSIARLAATRGVPPAYVTRTADARIDQHLSSTGRNPLDRLLLVAGPHLAGKSRTAIEALRRNDLEAARLIAPKPPRPFDPDDCAAALLRSRRRFRRQQPILWLDDLGTRLAAGTVRVEHIIGWLERHPNGLIAATATDDERVDLTLFRPLLLEPAQSGPVVELDDVLDDAEAADAHRLYPFLDGGWEQLPERLVLEVVQIDRYEEGRLERPIGSVGAAIVRAAVDYCRCHLEQQVSKAFLHAHWRMYLPHDPSPEELEAFDAALAWALTPAGRTMGLLNRCPDTDAISIDRWLISFADREGWQLSDATWEAILTDAKTRPDTLIAVATAAERRGRVDIWRAALTHALAHASPSVAEQAMRMLTSRSGTRPSPPPEAAEGARLEWEAPANDPFKPDAPRVHRTWPARIYRRPVLRAVLRATGLALGDLLAILASLAAALVCVSALLEPPALGVGWAFLHYGVFAATIAGVAFVLTRLYTEDAERARLAAIVSSVAWVTAAAAIIALVDRFVFSQYAVVAVATVLAVPAIYWMRRGYDRLSRAWIRRFGLMSRVVLVGRPPLAYWIGQILRDRPTQPLELLGFVCEEEHPRSLGQLHELDRVITTYGVDRVFLVDPQLSLAKRIEAADRCQNRNVRVALVPSPQELQLGLGAAHPYRAPGPVPIPPLRFSKGAAFVKSAFDIALSVVLLAVLAPLMLAIAIGIVISSPGGSPVVSSRRPGHEEKPFKLWRFRTTTVAHVRSVADREQATGGEPPSTGFGRLLRRYRLDELPQLFSVFSGHMSLVGPRPLPLAQYKQLDDWHKKRYHALPGITGEWQVSANLHVDLDEMARVDFAYITGWTLARDVAALLRTPGAVWRLARAKEGTI